MKPAIILALLFSAVFLFTACSDKDTGENKTEAVKISNGDDFEINLSDVTEKAKFFSVNVDGTDMEIIAVKDSSGKIRTAFNTCQICYDSGKGYYKQVNSFLVCQNCGSRFTADQIEVETGGCNPVPILDNDKIITDDTIKISYDFLSKTKEIFANWKTSY